MTDENKVGVYYLYADHEDGEISESILAVNHNDAIDYFNKRFNKLKVYAIDTPTLKTNIVCGRIG